MSRRRIDMTGRRIGRWLVLQVSAHRDAKRPGRLYWNCRCDCGYLATVSGLSLRAGNTQSCGCLRRERLSIIATTRLRTETGSFAPHTKGVP